MRARRLAAMAAALLGMVILGDATPAAGQEGQFYVLDGFGGVHAGGGAPAMSPATPYFGFDVAVDFTYVPAHQTIGGESGILVLDAFGGVHSGGPLRFDPPSGATPYFGFSAARAIIYRDRRPQVMSAVVQADGNLVQGSDGVTGATLTDTGRYLVTFDRSIQNCAMVAGVGLASHVAFDGLPGTLARSIRTGVETGFQGVNVEIVDPATGTASVADFHLIVTCPQP